MAVEIVCEIGCNHNCDPDIGNFLIQSAVDAGATAVKFQASVPERECSQVRDPAQFAMLKRVVPTREMLTGWAKYAEKAGIEFLCTPAEEESLAWLLESKLIRRVKVASDNLTNPPFLREVVRTGLSIILSTGMADIGQVYNALNGMMDMMDGPSVRNRVTLLHCTSAYPCPERDANLLAITTLQKTGLRVGWSDHTLGTDLAPLAVALGAVMIEKHMTFDRDAEGPDHHMSLEPPEFRHMVDKIRQAELALGNGIKVQQSSELECYRNSRKTITARMAIAKGENVTTQNAEMLRPGPRDGYSGAVWDKVVGNSRVADRDIAAGEEITCQSLD